MKFGNCLFCKTKFKKRYVEKKFCSLLCANRYNLNGLNKVTLPKKNADLAEFIGIILGDGHVTKYYAAVTLNTITDKEYIKYVAQLAIKLFQGAPVTIIQHKNQNATRIQISSKMVAQFLKNEGMISYKKIMPHWIIKKNVYKLACLRGLVDTEGSISYKIYQSRKGPRIYKQLNFRNYDLNLMIFVKQTLEQLGLNPTATFKKSLYLSNHDAIDKYRECIGFANDKLLQRSFVVDNNSYQKWRGTEAAITGRS